jgi:peptidyl-prolyl cis-trans isomerase SurA
MGTKKVWSAALAAACVLALLCGAGCKSRAGNADVMARVNGRKILSSELETYYRNQTAGHPASTPEQAQGLRLNILDELIKEEILMQRAQKLGLMATDQEVSDKLKEIRAPYTDEEFNKRLKERGITLAEFKSDLRRSITVDKVINKEIVSHIKISEADITDYYNQHKAEFNLIEPQYHLAQILVTTTPNPQVRNLKNDKAQNDAEARKKILMLEKRLAGGDDFAKLAMDYSEQPGTSPSGGDLGFIPESSLKNDPLVYAAISRLKPGEVTPPLPALNGNSRQIFGYRILKLISKEPAGQRQLKDPQVQKTIREQLRDRREQLLKTAYYESMRDRASVQNYLADRILKSSGE